MKAWVITGLVPGGEVGSEAHPKEKASKMIQKTIFITLWVINPFGYKSAQIKFILFFFSTSLLPISNKDRMDNNKECKGNSNQDMDSNTHTDMNNIAGAVCIRYS